KEIGLSHGLRLWDLKGVEYFWGSLHPIVLVIVFFVTGSTDIVLARIQSLAFGSLGVVLIFHLCRRYWNLSVAIAATAFAAIAPTSVFNDSSGCPNRWESAFRSSVSGCCRNAPSGPGSRGGLPPQPDRRPGCLHPGFSWRPFCAVRPFADGSCCSSGS